jgi:4'-phosphopantetheinyl transferase
MTSSILENEVHIWFCRPETLKDEEKLVAYRSVLSAQEIQQHERFHFEKDKHSYLVSHALLRHTLSKYASVDASQWKFSCNAHGKPELVKRTTALDSGIPALDFNLTHTDGLCACVVTLGKACGIDAENIHRTNRLSAVAQRMFADEELLILDENSDGQYQFFNFWTLREAYVKALGTGLAGSSKAYYFSVDTADMSASINFRNSQQTESSNWQFNLYEPTKQHRLAVAFESAEPMSVQITEFIP